VIVESQNKRTLLVSWGCGPDRARILVNIRIIALLGSRIIHDPTILDVFPWKTYVKRGLLKCDGMKKEFLFKRSREFLVSMLSFGHPPFF